MVNFYCGFLGARDVHIEKVIGKLLGRVAQECFKIIFQNTSTILLTRLDMIM